MSDFMSLPKTSALAKCRLEAANDRRYQSLASRPTGAVCDRFFIKLGISTLKPYLAISGDVDGLPRSYSYDECSIIDTREYHNKEESLPNVTNVCFLVTSGYWHSIIMLQKAVAKRRAAPASKLEQDGGQKNREQQYSFESQNEISIKGKAGWGQKPLERNIALGYN
ncbi:hypothetical protein EVAR_4109_1 [Eumeta japonica]|uniref:Uncharacterized protein n=1 Tax=Eumeta variegata TaxID=151549 RepID=A0A4C1T6T1_EUMVA|nr:hypothetical protein EVAR_4109_1 [Eumeta japonica]